MMRDTWRQAACALALTAATLMLIPSLAEAQITRVSRGESRQAIGFNIGYFGLRGMDSRDDRDVIFINVSDGAFGRRDKGLEPLVVKDFNNVSFGGEWLIGAGDFLEVGVGAGYYQRTVPSAYIKLQDDATGADIDQDFKLRIVPIVGTVRFLPIGRGRVAEPYVGAGVGLFNWRYSETGQFVDCGGFSDCEGGTIFSGRFLADGNAVGPVILGGVRFPIGDALSLGGEVRYQAAKGDIGADTGIPAEKIDLGGWNTSFTMHLRF